MQAVVLLALSGQYGFHRDELYFLAAGKHLDWGYVDQPPITPFLGRVSTLLFGDSPTGLRIVAILLGMATVVVAAMIAHELGGGEVLTAIGTALSSLTLVVSHMLSTTSVDLLVWVVLGYFAVRLLKSGDGRWWIPVGITMAVGLANKWLVLLLIAALGISVLIVGPRSIFRTWWLAIGVAVCLLLSAPVLIWQAQHDFPLLTVAGGISESDGTENRILFVPMQLVYLAPILVPVCVVGFLRLWRDSSLRAVALTYPALCLLTLATGGKPYYTAPLLLVLLAAGAAPSERWARSRRWWIPLAALGVATNLVVALPVLPVSALAPAMALNQEQGEQVGWPAFAETVTREWNKIPDKSRAVIFTRNYGQAGAIERYGPAQPYSGHMSYADWGPPSDAKDGPILLVGRLNDPALFRGCTVQAVHHSVIDNNENGVQISLCDGPSGKWSEIWPKLRRFYT
ncbi:hypothetical protein Lesp02_17250 [Lentzea sp. NBRC 105346]|nr:hypothetical protein Lesp02_17250 [Lentzea sp. NBRC 105346]